MLKIERWDISYNEAFFKTSHNSYEHSIREQLDCGLRSLEYDIHDDKIQDLSEFEVYHLPDTPHVLLNEKGNPDDLLLSNWLKLLVEWSNDQKREHAPITLFIEFKDCIVDENNFPDEKYGIGKLNKTILDSISSINLYTYNDFKKQNFIWPSVRELKGKIIIVLTSYWGGYWASSEGGFNSRMEYLNRSLNGDDGICFVAWIEEDKGENVNFMKDNVFFWKCNIDYSKKNFDKITSENRLTRVDFDKIVWGRHVKTYYTKNYENGYRCNFPSTDSWNEEKYSNCFPFSI